VHTLIILSIYNTLTNETYNRQMCRDPEVYKQPEEFNPDRFLGESPELDPALLIFGFGRRICPGRILADASMFITEAMTLWSFDVSCVEVDGKLSPPVYASKPGAIGYADSPLTYQTGSSHCLPCSTATSNHLKSISPLALTSSETSYHVLPTKMSPLMTGVAYQHPLSIFNSSHTFYFCSLIENFSLFQRRLSMSGFFAGTCIYRSKLYSKPYIQNISGLIVKSPIQTRRTLQL